MDTLKDVGTTARLALKGLEDLYWVTRANSHGMYDNNNEQLKDMLYAAKLAQAIEALQKARELLWQANELPQATFKRASK